MSSLHISISAEPIFHVGPLIVSNSMLTSLIVSVFLVAFSVIVGKALKNSGKISRIQTFVEMLIEGLYDFATEMTGSRKKAASFLPLVLTFFLWIVLNNWAGLLPGVGTIGFRELATESEVHAQRQGPFAPKPVAASEEKVAVEETEVVNEQNAKEVAAESDDHSESTEEAGKEEKAEGTFVPYFRAGTADLNTTIALALISVVSTQYFGFASLGGAYFKKYFNFKSPIDAFVGFLELILETAKIMSFAFRLFGNIFAGEVLLAVMMFLVPVIVPMPFYGLEIFVGMIQGVVFAMLSLVFFNLATHGHGEEH